MLFPSLGQGLKGKGQHFLSRWSQSGDLLNAVIPFEA